MNGPQYFDIRSGDSDFGHSDNEDLPSTLAQKAQQDDVQEARNALESKVKEASGKVTEAEAKKSTDEAIKKLEEANKQLAKASRKVTEAEARASAAEKQATAAKDRASAAEQKLESVKKTVRSEAQQDASRRVNKVEQERQRVQEALHAAMAEAHELRAKMQHESEQAQQDASRLVKTVEQELQRKDLLLNEAKAQLRRLMQESEASEKRRKELQGQVDLLRQEQQDEVQELQTQLEQARATNREFRQHSIRIIESLLESDMHWFRLQFERSTPPARPALSTPLAQGIYIPSIHGERPMQAAAFWH